jgi:hypothetical protein
MKTYLLLLLVIFAGLSFANAQQQGNRSEKVQALKIAFITQRLQLTTTQAQQFWPVYNQYQSEIRDLRKDKSDDALENEERLLNIRKKYKPSFQKIIGPEKLNDLYNAERDFRTVLIRQLKSEREQRGK